MDEEGWEGVVGGRARGLRGVNHLDMMDVGGWCEIGFCGWEGRRRRSGWVLR